MPVLLVLLAAGGCLLVLGALVLLRFPDRPGGNVEVEFGGQTVRISSLGAGLPLIAIGAALLALAFLKPQPSGSTPPATSRPATSAGPTTCHGRLLSDIPEDRRRTLEAGARAQPLLRTDQSKTGDFVITLSDGGSAVGAVRMRFLPSGQIFQVVSVTDARCAPVEDFVNEIRPAGDKRVLQNWDTLRIRLADRTYTLRPGSSNGAVSADFERDTGEDPSAPTG
ncbi:hypothetical protein [Streptomyces sp. NPDC091371]|uniref:hypothetical protein n=1 Tax=Streptomyces sp. NPDC091371 TaxID=3155303 RepID=UPI00341718AD